MGESTVNQEIEILRMSGVLWKGAATTTREALERAVDTSTDLLGADLRGAELSGADLVGAELRCGNLADANLTGADLNGADLAGANLIRADFTGANLNGVNLTRAHMMSACLNGADFTRGDLTRADLTRADLTGANLMRANLLGTRLFEANLTGVNLKDAHLIGIRDDLFAVLAIAKDEAAGLLTALHEGRVNGGVYGGRCACLIGTIANIRGESYDELGIDLRPIADRPAEVWFLAIAKGDTPATSPVVAITVGWIEDWLREHGG
jgi:uncharacterized protein YjbI with pentapeptide repeats